MAQYIAAIDQGTTSTRCIVFDRQGNIVALARREHRQIHERPGWVAHDALEIWRDTQAVATAALDEAGLAPHDIAAIGVTNQRETTVLWDRRTGQPVYDAIVWQDTRVDRAVAALAEAGAGDRLRGLTGLPLASYFSALKLAWLLDTVPGARARAEAGDLLFGTIDSWLVWNLTGGRHVTDVTNASRTQLMGLATLRWEPDLLDLFRIPASVLPEIRSSSEIFGEATGGLAGVPVAGILGDQQAALVGQACFRPGEAKNTYGTGCFLLMHTGERPVASRHGLITTVAYKFGDAPPAYALEGSIAVTGALVRWLRDNLGIIRTSAEIEALARTVEDNGDVYIVPAFAGLFAPHWRPDARGVIAGLTQYANRGHLARAALEAVAYQTRDVVDAMALDSGIALAELKVDGGMVGNELLMQFQADMLGVATVRPRVTETTALGAAYAAGLAVGLWRDLDELRDHWRADRHWQGTMAPKRRESLYAGWRKAVGRAYDWVE
jgi:glycerol kinase